MIACMLEGLLAFLVLAAAGIAGETWLTAKFDRSRANIWLADHIYLPALRMPALIGFVLASYPALYGLESAPALAALLDFDWFGHALNMLFILPLLFSLLPVAGRLSALMLPLQGMALTALLFMPLTAAMQVEASAWPDMPTLLAVLGFGIGGHFLGNEIASRLPQRKFALPAYDAIILLCQAPAIFTYGRMLGARL
ncbi:MAG TPA: hypothetical protein VF275_09510 [Gammaproteobacteria bacterium]